MAIRKIRKRGGTPGRSTITAQHVSRLDVNGDPQVKVFTKEAWDMIPASHYFDKSGIHNHSKSGWIPTTDKTVTKTPPRLKEEVAAEKPDVKKAESKQSPQTDAVVAPQA